MPEADALALVAIARRDLLAARGMTDASVFHEAVWGFQVQQTIEKTLKAWLYLSGVQPPFTHDLVALLKLLEEAGIDITPYRALARFTDSGLVDRTTTRSGLTPPCHGATQQISRTLESISDTDCDDKTRNRLE
ncbi:MAG: HEPN domain-containing protein [Cyanobium sp.]